MPPPAVTAERAQVHVVPPPVTTAEQGPATVTAHATPSAGTMAPPSTDYAALVAQGDYLQEQAAQAVAAVQAFWRGRTVRRGVARQLTQRGLGIRIGESTREACGMYALYVSCEWACAHACTHAYVHAGEVKSVREAAATSIQATLRSRQVREV